MRRIQVVFVVLSVILAASLTLAGDKKETWTGTIPVSGKHSAAELEKMTKVPMAAAEKTALAAIEAAQADKSIKKRELEVENGYLIYSFDIKIAGKKGIEEIIVDAGTGEVLAREHE